MFYYKLNDDTELRLLEVNQVEALYAVVDANRAHLRRWLPWVDNTRSPQDIEAFRQRILRETAENGSFSAQIWHQGKIAGVIGVHDIDWTNKHTSIGYWLAEPFQGKGLMTLTCRAVLDHLFGGLGLNRVDIRAAAGNASSRAVAERLGMRHEGTLRRYMFNPDGHAQDMEVYAMLREDWQDSQARIIFAHPLSSDAELRLLMPHHAEEVFTAIDKNRAYLQPYMTWTDSTTTVEHSRGFIRHALHRLAEGAEAHWGIWYQGRFAGGIGTLPINHDHKKVEIGYWIGEDYQGKGLVTSAGRAMLRYLFNTLGMNRVEIRYKSVNIRSAGVARRLGFSIEGTQRQAFRINGETADLVSTALLREEWEAKQCR